MMKNLLIALLLISLSKAYASYERCLDLDSLKAEVGEAIIYPTFTLERNKLSTALRLLAENSQTFAPNGIGMSIIPILDIEDANVLVSLDLEGKNYFQILDLICVKAGNEYYWSATIDGVVILKADPDGDLDSNPLDPFPNQ